MKHNKHIHDEDYDINIKLMVPLLSILVCTICLCATTWAWYTASVTSGVSTITAGAINANVSITLEPTKKLSNEEEAGIEASSNQIIPYDGYYTLTNGFKYKVNITNEEGTSSSGYHCMLTVMNCDGSLLGIFYTKKFDQKKEYEFLITPQFECNSIQIKVDTMWGVPPDDAIIISENKDAVLSLDSESGNQLKIENASNFALGQVEIDEDIPKYSYTIKFIDIDTYFEIRDSISEETIQEVLDIADYKIENYEFVSATNGELGEDDVLYLDIDTEAETTELVISYRKVVIDPEEEPSSAEEQEIINSEAESQANSSQGPTESITETGIGESNEPPVDENNSETSEDGSSNLSTSNSENQATSEQEIETSQNNTKESLLLTETTSGEETSSETQSTDSSSSNNTSSETESNVSE